MLITGSELKLQNSSQPFRVANKPEMNFNDFFFFFFLLMPVHEGVHLYTVKSDLYFSVNTSSRVTGTKPNFAIEPYSCWKRLFLLLIPFAAIVSSFLHLFLYLLHLLDILFSVPISYTSKFSIPSLLPLLPLAYNRTLDLPKVALCLLCMPVIALLPSLLLPPNFSISWYTQLLSSQLIPLPSCA